MCTSIKWNNYFGRTLDNTFNYKMNVVITPRKYSFSFRHTHINDKNYSIIGMAHVENNYPLYSDAINEKGLAIAALEFPDYAHYFNNNNDKNNVCVFEIIPYILRQCKNIEEVRKSLENINIINESFNDNLFLTPLHFIISDLYDSIVLESTIDGIKVYDNPYNVLTNNPDFNYHKVNINNYLNLTSEYPNNRLSKKIDLKPFSYSFGLIGLPGDYSSPSRFIKALFLINNTNDVDDKEKLTHYFHILDAVGPIKGIALNEDGISQYTIYSSAMDMNNIIYYYKTYWDNQIKGVRLLEKENNLDKLIIFNVNYTNNINYLN